LKLKLEAVTREAELAKTLEQSRQNQAALEKERKEYFERAQQQFEESIRNLPPSFRPYNK